MAKFSRAQYELLTEAFGAAVAKVHESGSPLLDATAIKVAHIVADHLKHDNANFNQRQFIEGIEATAQLERMSRDGINLQ